LNPNIILLSGTIGDTINSATFDRFSILYPPCNISSFNVTTVLYPYVANAYFNIPSTRGLTNITLASAILVSF